MQFRVQGSRFWVRGSTFWVLAACGMLIGVALDFSSALAAQQRSEGAALYDGACSMCHDSPAAARARRRKTRCTIDRP